MKLILILVLVLCPLVPARSAELLGRISTNPADPAGRGSLPVLEPPPSGLLPPGLPIFGSARPPARPVPDRLPLPEAAEATAVLGISHFPAGSLLRGPDRRIFLILAQGKKHIRTLGELQNYRGREIFDVDGSVLDGYGDIIFSDSDLIRQIGRPEVYVIRQGRRVHIKSLAELARHYLGQEIHNIPPALMKDYS